MSACSAKVASWAVLVPPRVSLLLLFSMVGDAGPSSWEGLSAVSLCVGEVSWPLRAPFLEAKSAAEERKLPLSYHG